jgi:acyl-CoA reductase-like NAD-dependent aldehyde dehydrogenase
MLGMPLTAMREKAGFIGKMLMGLPQIYEHTDIEGRKPYGIVLACTPGNDISASTFVLANMVLTGSTGVIRPSSSEVHFTTKVAEILTESGYPAGALNVVNYGRGRDTLTQILGNNTDLKIIFGDDSTVSRFKEFGGKVIGYGAGRALAIVDESADPEKTADMLVEGSMVYPIGCNKTMGVRLPRSMLADIQRRVIARVDALTVGDPRNLDTRVGYVDKTMLTCMLDRIEHLRDLEVIEIARQGRRISDMQATPFVIISDPTSEFMTQEFPNYVLAFCPNGDLAEAVTQTEYVRSAKDLPKHLVISIFGDEHKQEVLAARERLLYRTAHSVHLNMPTNHIDPRSHQNISLPHELSRASVHALVA